MKAVLRAIKGIPRLIIRYPARSAIAGTGILIYTCRCYCKHTAGVCILDEDMSGKTVLITGATAGIGKATAFDLARRNARVILACRDIGKALLLSNEIIKETGNDNVDVVSLDLSSFKSVRLCAERVLETEKKLHVLINNAGIVGGQGRLTADGCEITMQTNHFGHFLLTILLLDLLKKSAPSRIINVSAGGHRFAKLDLANLNKKLPNFQAYVNSKLANILFTIELSKRLKGTGITVNAVHPGVVKTDIMNFETNLMTITWRTLYNLFGKTPESGAQTTIQVAIDPSLEETTGKYFGDCIEEKPAEVGQDEVAAKRLFEESERITGVKFPENIN